MAQLDFHKLRFPLVLRTAQEGDRFQPLGMGGKSQKLSDFFTHLKLPVYQKWNTWVLETADKEICWVVNYRLDERFKLSAETTCCYEIVCKKIEYTGKRLIV